jgi:hypothetical protein
MVGELKVVNFFNGWFYIGMGFIGAGSCILEVSDLSEFRSGDLPYHLCNHQFYVHYFQRLSCDTNEYGRITEYMFHVRDKPMIQTCSNFFIKYLHMCGACTHHTLGAPVRIIA